MRIIFSRDRAAQLDLLLQSLARNAPPEPTVVIARADEPYRSGYRLLERYWPARPRIIYGEAETFEADVRRGLAEAGEFVTFLCDDDVLFAPLPEWRLEPDEVSFSWRLGMNTRHCYPRGRLQRVPQLKAVPERWRLDWQTYDGDFGYPGSLDGHCFRASDLRIMLEPYAFSNPTELEDALQSACLGFTGERPLMACYPRSVLCSVPVNRVSEQSQVRAGTIWPQPAERLNERFLAGERIDLDALDFSAVDAAHYELEFKWRPA